MSLTDRVVQGKAIKTNVYDVKMTQRSSSSLHVRVDGGNSGILVTKEMRLITEHLQWRSPLFLFAL